MGDVKERLYWLVGSGLPRWSLKLLARLRDPLATFLIDTRRDNIHPFIEQVRDRGRISSFAGVGWVTADAEVVRQILRDDRFRTLKPQDRSPYRLMQWVLAKTDPGLPSPVEPPSILVTDPPEHTRLRRAVSRTFTPRAVDELRDRVQQVTDELLDELERRPEADLVAGYCRRIPLIVIADLLGIPRNEVDYLHQAGEPFVSAINGGVAWSEYRGAAQALDEFAEYFDMHVARIRGGHAPDSLLSQLTLGSDLTDIESKVFGGLLFGAGYVTTAYLLGKAVVTLTRHPDQLASLLEHPEGWPNAVEEILRYDTSVQLAGRVATENVDIGGHTVRPGQAVYLLLGGANRDPNVFDRPDVFDITRANAREHIGFGTGIHACLGAALARMELQIGLQSLFERFPTLALSGEPTWMDSSALHGLKHLPVSLGPAAVRA